MVIFFFRDDDNHNGVGFVEIAIIFLVQDALFIGTVPSDSVHNIYMLISLTQPVLLGVA